MMGFAIASTHSMLAQYVVPAEPAPVRDCRNPEAKDGKL
jgi:hypothetical protein